MSAGNFRKKIYSTELHKVRCGGFEIEFSLNRKAIRRLYLVIKKNSGKLLVNAPRQMPFSLIAEFISKKASWIASHQQKIIQKTIPNFATSDFDFSEEQEAAGLLNSNDKEHFKEILLFGKAFKLEVIKEESKKRLPKFKVLRSDSFNKNSLNFHLNYPQSYLDCVEYIEFFSSTTATKQQKQAAIEFFYRQQILELTVPLLEKWQKVIGVKANSLQIRKMHTRHGSCNVRKAKIWLSQNLAKVSPKAVEYVLVHELVHLLEPSHNRRFVEFMNKFLPDWKTRKELLNR